jgi:hypothetical protein
VAYQFQREARMRVTTLRLAARDRTGVCGPLWVLVLAMVIACSSSSKPAADVRDDAGVADGVAGQDDFWRFFEADYEWVEFHPTLKDAVAGSDATLLGRFASVSRGVVIQGDAVEDVYEEVNVRVEVLEAIHGDALNVESLELTLPSPNRRLSDSVLDAMQRSLPKAPVLLILRKRASGLYRVVNGYGLWLHTARAELDAPLCAPDELEFVAAETAGHGSAHDLAASLR